MGVEEDLLLPGARRHIYTLHNILAVHIDLSDAALLASTFQG